MPGALVASLLLVVRPGATSSVLAPSSVLARIVVAMPGAPSSVIAPSSVLAPSSNCSN